MLQVRNPQVRRLLDLVSPRVGVITKLERISHGVDEPNPPVVYRATLAHYDFKKSDPQDRTASGKGVTEEDAIAGAIGEAIERYCANHPALDLIKRIPPADLQAPAITPADCVLYSASQYSQLNFPYLPWKEGAAIGWLPARELPGDREVFIPAFLTYLNYYGPNGEDNLCASTSNGLAAGPDMDSAILSGLSELIERDAFMAHWMNRLPAPEVELEGGIAGAIRAHYRLFNINTRVFNISTDLRMYAMMAISLSDDPRMPSALFGLGCHLNPRIAIEKALFELCQIRPGEAAEFKRNHGSKLKNYSDVKNLRDHSAFLMSHERKSELAFLFEAPRRQRIEDLPNLASGSTKADLDTVVKGLTHAGSRVAYADLTTPDIEPFGVRVVRTIATGLQPIHFGHGEERLGAQRLFELPRILKYTEEIRTEADLNPCPHPLA